jgi:hypothetical protein
MGAGNDKRTSLRPPRLSGEKKHRSLTVFRNFFY